MRLLLLPLLFLSCLASIPLPADARTLQGQHVVQLAALRSSAVMILALISSEAARVLAHAGR